MVKLRATENGNNWLTKWQDMDAQDSIKCKWIDLNFLITRQNEPWHVHPSLLLPRSTPKHIGSDGYMQQQEDRLMLKTIDNK